MRFIEKISCLLLFLIIGFNATAQTTETHKRLFDYSSKSTSRGKIYTSKPAPGFVTLQDGLKVDGLITVVLIERNEQKKLQGITLETGTKKLELQPVQVATYGLELTIADYLGKKAGSPNKQPGAISIQVALPY